MTDVNKIGNPTSVTIDTDGLGRKTSHVDLKPKAGAVSQWASNATTRDLSAKLSAKLDTLKKADGSAQFSKTQGAKFQNQLEASTKRNFENYISAHTRKEGAAVQNANARLNAAFAAKPPNQANIDKAMSDLKTAMAAYDQAAEKAAEAFAGQKGPDLEIKNKLAARIDKLDAPSPKRKT